MFEAHNVFQPPSDEHVKVWRYMDFTKLISLLESNALYFVRTDKFEDPYEGTWPRANVDAMRFAGTNMVQTDPTATVSGDEVVSMFTGLRKFMAVNCWHMNEHESAAMWRLYLKTNEGIAVQTTYSRLRDSIIDQQKVWIGKVEYVDYESAKLDQANALTAIVHKRLSFEHEREIRAVAFVLPETDESFTDAHLAAGLSVKVDLPTLIERIYVAPDAPGWFVKLVELVVNRYGLKSPVVQSGLYTRSLF